MESETFREVIMFEIEIPVKNFVPSLEIEQPSVEERGSHCPGNLRNQGKVRESGKGLR